VDDHPHGSGGLAQRREKARWRPSTEQLRRPRSGSSSTGSSERSGPRISTRSCRPWEETFASFEGQIGYAVSDLHITAADEVAFSHSLNRMSGTATSGEAISMWVRWTACFRKLDGRWLITHEQVSVPIDMDSGNAPLDLEPHMDAV
jgi:SnoaL-like domain